MHLEFEYRWEALNRELLGVGVINYMQKVRKWNRFKFKNWTQRAGTSVWTYWDTELDWNKIQLRREKYTARIVNEKIEGEVNMIVIRRNVFNSSKISF